MWSTPRTRRRTSSTDGPRPTLERLVPSAVLLSVSRTTICRHGVHLLAVVSGLSAWLSTYPGSLSGQGSGWNSERALAIAGRAIEARKYAYADSSLTRFEARVQGHIYFLGEFRGEREVVRADQVALDIRWQAPDRAVQTIVGRRHEVRLPTRIQYHIDHLSLVLDNFGNRIRLGDGDEVWGVLHPAAPGAPLEYEYRLADSLEIRIRDRTARLYRLDVRPIHPERPAVVGSMFVDRETGAIARLRITFTAAAYRDPTLQSIALDLRSALWEGRYWLPAEQDVEITRSLSWLDFPLEGVIRTKLVVLDYDLDGDFSWILGPGQRVASLPESELEDYWMWESRLYDGPLESGDRSDEELSLALRDARSFVRPELLAGGERLKASLPDLSSGLRLRRAEGVLVGGGGRVRLDEDGHLSFWGGYATGAERVEASAALTRSLGVWEASLQAHLRGYRDVGPFTAASGVEQTLGLVFEGEDYTDPFFEDGARVSIGKTLGAGHAELGTSILRQRQADLIVETVMIGRRPLRPVRPIDDGELVAIDGALDLRVGDALGAAWSIRLRGEAATAAIGSFGFTRATLGLLASRDAAGSRWGWSSELVVGASGGDLPAQRLFLLGGRATVPGYEFRAWGGDRVAHWRGDVSRAIAWPWVSLRLSGFAGWADLTEVGSDAAARFGAIPTHGVRTSLGAGIGLFYDILRIDLVRGLEGARPEDPVAGDWVLLLSLDPLLWSIL